MCEENWSFLTTGRGIPLYEREEAKAEKQKERPGGKSLRPDPMGHGRGGIERKTL